MKVLITGGSHAGSLHRGLALLRERGDVPADLEIQVTPLGHRLAGVGRFFERVGDRLIITHEDYRQRLPVISRQDTPFDAIGLTSPFHSRGIWMRPDWTRFSLAGADAQRAPLSRSLLRQTILDHNEHLIDFLQQVKSLGFLAFAIEGPKPFRHNPELRRAGIETARFIDHEYQRLTLERLRALGLPAVMMPPSTFDAEGYCRDEFRHEDPADTHHGNAALGAVMMGEIIRHLRTAGAR